jgi:hypothetical protein
MVDRVWLTLATLPASLPVGARLPVSTHRLFISVVAKLCSPEEIIQRKVRDER